MIGTLQQLSFNYRFIYKAFYVDATQSCSNWPNQDATSPRERRISADRPTAIGSIPRPANDNLAALMLGRGHFRVSTSAGI
ncbi:hypothetical protein QNM99_16070 [Pseudomonas sp. PCH446]